MVKKVKAKTGTREWAEHSRNIQLGCENDCRYCYAREMAVRFKRTTAIDWSKPVLMNNTALKETPRKLKGRIMFPTTHDITRNNLSVVCVYLVDWLRKGNEFLIVTKPDLFCIEMLTKVLEPYKDQVTFRFTIGSTDDVTLKFWEPNAPNFESRLNSLVCAYTNGFKTSVACEPYLDATIVSLVERVLPYVTDVVWIGKMNQIKKRVMLDKDNELSEVYMYNVELVQSNHNVKLLYEHFKNNPKVKWKDSIKKVIGLPEEAIG